MPGLRSRVASLLRTRKAILMLSGSMKSIPLVRGIRATLDVVGVKVLSELGKYWTSFRLWTQFTLELPSLKSRLFTSESWTAWVTFSISLLYLCSFRFARLTKGVEGRLGPKGPPVAPGLPADLVRCPRTRGWGPG